MREQAQARMLRDSLRGTGLCRCGDKLSSTGISGQAAWKCRLALFGTGCSGCPLAEFLLQRSPYSIYKAFQLTNSGPPISRSLSRPAVANQWFMRSEKLATADLASPLLRSTDYEL